MKALAVREPRQLRVDRGCLTSAGDVHGKVYELNTFTTIGRDLSCHIIITDPFISLRHARIEAKEDGYYVRDLSSRNGTWLNGTRVLEARLATNDRIRIGNTELIFTSDNLSALSDVFTTSLNPVWNEQLQRVPAIAQSTHPVLLLGPSGAGKEVLASMIHKLSRRAKLPLVSVNCSALSEGLAESELFGHVQGAFSGATSDRKGAFETARGGTLFLDEIGDLPITLQPKLLRALENQEIRPVGSDKTIKVDVRIIAATNQNLRLAAQSGHFREDLYFRLHILQLNLPALRNRMEDFDNLMKYFCDPLNVRFSLPALMKLRDYDWPGNIRELKNVVMRASALFPNQQVDIRETEILLGRLMPAQEITLNTNAPALSLVRQFEKDLIVERLVANQGNQRRTAKDLGMPKSTLHDRIKAFGIDLATIKGRKTFSDTSQ